MKAHILILVLMLISIVSFSKTNHILLITFEIQIEEENSSIEPNSRNKIGMTQDRIDQFKTFQHQTLDNLLFEVKYKQGIYTSFLRSRKTKKKVSNNIENIIGNKRTFRNKNSDHTKSNSKNKSEETKNFNDYEKWKKFMPSPTTNTNPELFSKSLQNIKIIRKQNPNNKHTQITILQTKSDPQITLFELDNGIHPLAPYTNQNPIWFIEQHSGTYPVNDCCRQENSNISNCTWVGIIACTGNPSPFNFNSGQGSKTIYLWVRDILYNVSDPATLNLVYDTAPPVIASFSGPGSTDEMTINISFNASDVTSYVAGYFIKENDNTTPDYNDPGWLGDAPGTFTLSALPGHKTLYGWCKDPAGNISNPVSFNTYYDAYNAVTVPLSFSYQAVARDNIGNPLTDQVVSFHISILKETTAGETVYSETHTDTTNSFGLSTLNIGTGFTQSGNFEEIEWGQFDHFLKIEMDETGGSNYQLMGTSQLLSVPYALSSGNAKEHLNHLKDVDTTNLQPGTMLQWNGSYWEGVDSNDLKQGSVLQWNGQQWQAVDMEKMFNEFLDNKEKNKINKK